MLRFLCCLLMLPGLIGAVEFSFPDDCAHWDADFADYPIGQEEFYELQWRLTPLPTIVELADGRRLATGLFLSGNNHSDDLFMFARRKMEGFRPNTVYALFFSVLIETDVAANTPGIGGSPGESVFFKVGASTEKPQKVSVCEYYHLNVDKGNQAEGGKNAVVIGNLANETVDPDEPFYLPKQLYNERPLLVQTDSNGDFWIFLGTDSGFEGVSAFYIVQVSVDIEPRNQSR